MNKLKPAILFLVFCCFVIKARATHIVGGEITYRHLWGNSYIIYLDMYVDCINGSHQAIELDKDGFIGIFNQNNLLLDSIPIIRSNPVRIEKLNYACVLPNPNACVDYYGYHTAVVNLPPISGGYTLVYQRCCRNHSISNLTYPGSTGATYKTHLPDVAVWGYNSSPKFQELPPNFLCTGEPLSFNHIASDPDGDSLVYELCQPFHGGSTSDPLPDPSTVPPPFKYIVWASGYSNAYQINADPGMKITSDSGKLTLTPTKSGQFVIGICVSEYRNGKKMNTTLRDFQFNVSECVFDANAKFSYDFKKCSNTMTFKNQSTGSAITGYHWDFGVDEATGDTSGATHPTFTFPGPGEYIITLDALADDCKSTYQSKIMILSPDIPGLSDSFVCRNTTLPIGYKNSVNNLNFEWFPKTGLTDPYNSMTEATAYDDIVYTLRKSGPSCYVEGQVNLTTDKIRADFEFKYLPPCDGLKVIYTEKAVNADRMFWDLGDPNSQSDTGSGSDYSWYYKDTGIIYVNFRVENEKCSHDTLKPIRIYFPEEFSDVTDSSICLGDTLRLGPKYDTAIVFHKWTPDEYLQTPDKVYSYCIPKKPGNYTYAIEKDYLLCKRYDTFHVTVHELPKFEAGTNRFDSICPGDSALLFASGDYSFEWFPSEDFSNPYDDSVYAYPKQYRYYRVRATSGEGCYSDDSVDLHVFPHFQINFALDSTLCKDTELVPVHHLPDVLCTTWTLSESGQKFFPPQGPTDEGMYRVFVETKCQLLEDTLNVHHYTGDYCKMYMPNVFSPNDDGINDTYPFGGRFDEVFGKECDFDEYYLVLFNRWGQVVFRATDPRQEWDGFFADTESHIQVFGYYLQYREYDWCVGHYRQKVQRGNFTIIK